MLSTTGDARWAELMAALRPVATRLSRRFPEFDDVEARLAEGCVGGLGKADEQLTPWIEEYVEVSRAGSTKPLVYFVENKLRDHLKAQREKERSRRAKIDALGGAPVATGSSSVPPDETLEQQELLKQAASMADPDNELFVRAVLSLKDSGFSGTEISKLFGVSEAKVSRTVSRVAQLGNEPDAGQARKRLIQAIIAALAIVLIAYGAFQLLGKDDPLHEPITEEPTVDEVIEAPAVNDEEEETPIEEEPDSPTETEAPAPMPEPEVPAPTHATLEINASPWAHVYVNGTDTGLITPVSGYRVDPGRHVIRLVTPAGAERTVTVDVDAGETEQVMVRIDEAESGGLE